MKHGVVFTQCTETEESSSSYWHTRDIQNTPRGDSKHRLILIDLCNGTIDTQCSNSDC